MSSWDTWWSFEPLVREAARLRRTLTRRKWVFVIAVAVPAAVTGFYLWRAPDRYEGVAKIIVGRASAEDALNFSTRWEPQGKELENQLELVKSHEVITAAAALGRRRYPAAPPSPEEIIRALTVKPLKGTDIIEIQVEALDADRAATLANLLGDAYIAAHLNERGKRAENRKEFIDSQVALYEQRLRASEEALEAYKHGAGVAALDTETDELIRMDAAYESDLERTRVDLAVAESKRRFYEDELRRMQERLLTAAADVSSPVAKQLQDKLVALEYRYANLILKGYSPEHAELNALAREIRETRAKLADEAAGFNGGDGATNPFAKIEALAGQLDTTRAEVVALTTRRAELSTATATAGGRLSTVPAKESALGDLVREKEANEKMYLLLLEKREEAGIEVAAEIGTARFFSRAEPPAKPFAPRRVQSLLLGIVAGLFLGVAAVAAVEYFDRTVKNAALVHDIVRAPVLGIVPFLGRVASEGTGSRRKRGAAVLPGAVLLPVVARGPKSPGADAFRTIYAQVAYLFAENGGAKGVVLGFTSSRPGEGKSTISANLATTFAQFGVKTLLVDADFNRSALGRMFPVESLAGLVDYLRGTATFEDTLSSTPVPNLTIVGTGSQPSEPGPLLASAAFGDFIRRAKEQFDVIFVDVPPVYPVADVALIASAIRKFVFVVRAGAINAVELDRAVNALGQVGGTIIGAVLNGADAVETYGGYRYSHYYNYRKAEDPAKPWAAAQR